MSLVAGPIAPADWADERFGRRLNGLRGGGMYQDAIHEKARGPRPEDSMMKRRC